ncbi:hypothetical protein [Planomonospora venezuelensis]|uniref:HEPN domain-containing protein n=1 Tax=Planomonospora venezuelensis TaxID=1999 RepID=A0A841D6J0_PLAVE|nr:hypothetical protein [Planomonospora venezuelensis]MBB5965500.1 hypothetical protein [Planomonospora venezuelensis]GIN03369.1 hypothetical protein Pve01_50270 [Planomonospora venezuelensis]
MSVDVGRNQLRASFVSHREAAHAMKEGAPAALLLFYGVECGLKAALLDRQGLKSTAQLPEQFRNHDLHRLAKELRLAPPLCNRMRPCTSQKQEREQVAFADLHQAWRYGHALKKDHEEKALAVLRELLDWCQRELRA